jgi:lipoprotein NlpI
VILFNMIVRFSKGPRRAMWIGSLLLSAFIVIAAAQPAKKEPGAPDATALLQSASTALKNGDTTNALTLASRAITLDPKSSLAYMLRASIYEKTRQHAKAITDYNEVLKLEPDAAGAYQRRGFEYFRLGRFLPAIADFNKVIELDPRLEPHHWQRGIAYYYAGEFDKGRRQFESHQKVNTNDVENAVWHFLCVARLSGVEKARAALIPIQGDSRVPMKEVHELFAGKIKPADVLTAARAGNPSPEQLKLNLFYAHLYLGLYYEALGDPAKTREEILQAANEYAGDDYMGDVARVHARLLEKTK